MKIQVMRHLSLYSLVFLLRPFNCQFPTNPLRIIGGRNASPGQFPYQVSLRYRRSNGRYKHYCGGALIGRNTVLTTAHCIGRNSVSRFLVILGDYRTNRKERTEQLFKLRRVYVHPRYNRRRVTNDLAILKLAGKVRYTKTVKRVRLAKPGQNFVGSTCIISGWGATRGGGRTSNILQFTRVTVITSRRCQRSYDDIFGRVICFLSNDRGSGICDGDSGGPAVCHGVLAGVTSFGVDDCLTHYPSVYTRVSYYNKYIRQRL